MTCYYAIINEDLTGPAYGIGTTEEHARSDAKKWGFGDGGTCVEITKESFQRILKGNPGEVEIIG